MAKVKPKHDGLIDEATTERLMSGCSPDVRDELRRIVAERNALTEHAMETESVRVWQEDDLESGMKAGVIYWESCGDDVADGW